MTGLERGATGTKSDLRAKDLRRPVRREQERCGAGLTSRIYAEGGPSRGTRGRDRGPRVTGKDGVEGDRGPGGLEARTQNGAAGFRRRPHTWLGSTLGPRAATVLRGGRVPPSPAGARLRPCAHPTHACLTAFLPARLSGCLPARRLARPRPARLPATPPGPPLYAGRGGGRGPAGRVVASPPSTRFAPPPPPRIPSLPAAPARVDRLARPAATGGGRTGPGARRGGGRWGRREPPDASRAPAPLASASASALVARPRGPRAYVPLAAAGPGSRLPALLGPPS